MEEGEGEGKGPGRRPRQGQVTRPRSSSFPSTEPSAYPYPDRSALEPPSSYSRRSKKWRIDNARWEGQKRALENLDKKQTRIPQPLF